MSFKGEDSPLLKHLIEEAAEVVQAATKCQRFGYDSWHPDDIHHTTNNVLLAREIGNLIAVVTSLGCVIPEEEVQYGVQQKIKNMRKYGDIE